MTAKLLNFTPSTQEYSIGVEVEMQLLKIGDMSLAATARQMLMRVPDRYTSRIKGEFRQCMFEIATDVCADINQLGEELQDLLRRAEVLARETGCISFAGSLHPESPWPEQQISNDERYHEIMAELQESGRRLITQGMHVHVGMKSGDDAVRVCDAIRVHLPVLLALSASSPFYNGHDTGFQSYRSILLEDLPRSGMPGTLINWQRCSTLLGVLQNAGLIKSIREIWWDVRPHPELGTLEIRVCDVPHKFDEIMGLAALIQALVITLDRMKEKPPFPGLDIVKSNKWAAARHGLEARLISHNDPRKSVSCLEAAEELFALVHDAARENGSMSQLGTLKRVLRQGNGAGRLLALHKRQGTTQDMLREIHGEFWA